MVNLEYLKDSVFAYDVKATYSCIRNAMNIINLICFGNVNLR
jgi:hypothetical protein